MNLDILHNSLRQIRRLIIFLIGMTVVLLGVLMIVTPGPAFLIIPVGLGILAIEFEWARRVLKRTRAYVQQQAKQIKDKINNANLQSYHRDIQ